MRTLRVVFDSNVWVAALVASGTSKEVVREARRFCELYTSPYILAEVDRVLSSKFAADAEQRRDSRRLIEAICHIEPDPPADPKRDPSCRDPKDRPILRLALAIHADLLVTGDDDLLILKEIRGIRIVAPSRFWHTK